MVLFSFLTWYEVGGSRAATDQEWAAYWQSIDAKPTNNETRYYDGYGRELTRAQATHQNPVGFIGRHLDAFLWRGFGWLLILMPVAFVARRGWRSVPEPGKAWLNVYWFLLAIITVELILTLYLVDVWSRDPLSLMVRTVEPERPLETLAYATVARDPFAVP